MKIGELSKKTGCSVVTIRFYEQTGLLQNPPRTPSNYRSYSKADLNRLEFILHCRKHDISLDEIKSLLSYQENPTTDCAWIGDMLDKHIKSVTAQIKSLKKLKENLKNLRCQCSGHEEARCNIVQNLKSTQLCGCEH